MDTKNNSADSKHKGRLPRTDNVATSKDEKAVTTPISNSTGHKGEREHRERKKHERSRDNESWNSGNGRRENCRDVQPKDKFTEEKLLPQPYGYNPATDGSYLNSSHSNIGMMSLVPYGTVGTVGCPAQWALNAGDGLNSDIHVNATSNMSVNFSVDMSANSGIGLNAYTSYIGMPANPNMYGMMSNYGQPQYNMLGTENNFVPVNRKVIHLTKCVLYPPPLNSAPPPLRAKPPGCRTVYVGGVPENATKEIMKEVFEQFGELSTIRMSKKNFCHIRFASATDIDKAVGISSYWIKIDDKDDVPNMGQLHVDYAEARDDQHEFECQQRALQRQARHRERLEQEVCRPPTLTPIVSYTDHEAGLLGEKLRGEDTFQQAVFVLFSWLEKGECIKRNSGYFYSMIHSTFSHVKRLVNEKKKYEEELNKAKMMLQQQMKSILVQLNEIGKVFNAACQQKVWDHFTKAQRKHILTWKTQAEETKNAHVEVLLNDRVEDEMEVSDGEDDISSKKTDPDSACILHDFGVNSNLLEEIAKLRDENNSLQCQLKACENELVVERTERHREEPYSGYQRKKLHQAGRSVEGQLAVAGEVQMPFKLQKKNVKDRESSESSNDWDDDNASHVKGISDMDIQHEIHRGIGVTVSQAEVLLIGFISIFLNVHPRGASVDYICSYLETFIDTVHARDVEALMRNFPIIFKEDSKGVGATLEKKWVLCRFNKMIRLNSVSYDI